MANTIMSHLGESPQRSGGDEELIPIIGDGAAKAGMMVGMLSTGKAVAIDGDSATAGISFVGIMDRSVITDYDTAIPDDQLENAMVPKSGRKYSAFIADPGATFQKGHPLTWSLTTAGSLMIMDLVSPALDGLAGFEKPIVAYLDEIVVNTETVAKIRWA